MAVLHGLWLAKTDLNYSINFSVFLTVAVLSFLICYKIADCLVEIKEKEQASWADIIFLFVFFVFLCIPASKINQDDVSKGEFRTLAAWQPPYTEQGLNYNFGKNFENWFNDRFCLRRMLNECYIMAKYYINETFVYKDLIINKKEKTCFAGNDREVYQNISRFSEKDIDNIYNNIANINNICKKKNIQFFVLLSVGKESIYPELYPKQYLKLNVKPEKDVLIEKLQALLGSNFVYAKDELLELKPNHKIFLATDTHSSPPYTTSITGFSEYSKLINAIKLKKPEVKPIRLSDCDIRKKNKVVGNLVQSSEFLSNKLMEKQRVYKVKKNRATEIYRENFVVDKYEKTPVKVVMYENKEAGNNLYAVIIGDSFHRRFHYFIAQNFRKTATLFRSDHLDLIISDEIGEKVFNQKPDILIIQSTENNFYKLKNFGALSEILERQKGM